MKRVKLLSPIMIDGKETHEITLKLEELTGTDIIKVDQELRLRGASGFNSIFSQEGLLLVASKASGIICEDLQRLSAPDFIEVTAMVQNFLLGLGLTANMESQTSES